MTDENEAILRCDNQFEKGNLLDEVKKNLITQNQFDLLRNLCIFDIMVIFCYKHNHTNK